MQPNNNIANRIFIILFLSLLSPFTGLYAQENYIRTYVPREALRPGTALGTNNSLVETGYYDVAGRFVQSVKHAFSPGGKDMASLTLYDGLGRVSREWVPIPLEDSDGGFRPSAVLSSAPSAGLNYVDYQYEPTVWHRVSNEVGRNSLARGIRTEYLFNTELLPELSVWNFQASSCDYLSRNGKYADGSLTCIKKTDEDGNIQYTFSDPEQRVVLERRMNGTTPHDTHYIYNDWGQLVMVLPPALADELPIRNDYQVPSCPEFGKYAYLYKYDRQNHRTGRKLPGCDWHYTVYDGDHRPVMEQTGKQRPQNEWTFRKYDFLGRVILEGTVVEQPYSTLVVKYADLLVREEYVGQESGGRFGYTTNIRYLFPETVHKVYYYDSYDFLSLPLFSEGLPIAPSIGDYPASSLQTGSYTSALEESEKYELSASYYDHRGRTTRTDRYNGVSDTDTRVYTRYNFNDCVTESRTYYVAPNEECSKTIGYSYDLSNRKGLSSYLITHAPLSHHFLSQKWGDLERCYYDEFGRLSQKVLLDGKDTISMDYDSHSRLRGIRNRHFTQTLYYDTSPDRLAAPSYNGQISWMGICQEGVRYGYGMKYDGLGRLTDTQMYFMNSPGVILSGKLSFSEYFDYDKMGNLTIFRQEVSGGFANDLYLSYHGNQLRSICKSSAPVPPMEYSHMSCGVYEGADGYQYDPNGNETRNLANGIYHSSYNVLNLPDSVLIDKSGNTSKMTYMADGRRMRTVHTTYSTGLSYLLDDMQGFNDPLSTSEELRDGDLLFKDGMLARLDVPGGYFNLRDPVYDKMTGYYFLTDHLGSVRLTCESVLGAVVQNIEYTPSGTIFRSNELMTALQPKRYCGKEELGMHGYNMYDSGARFHTSKYFRFTSVDPLAEKYYSISPYAYCMGNPVKFVDPTGNYVESAWDIFSLVTGAKSFVDNVRAGNVGAAVVDGFGVVVDAAAVILPGIPGGVGVAAKGVRALDKAVDAAKAVDKAFDTGKAVEKTVGTSRAARREVMRKEGIPTSQQPVSRSKNASGREYSYDVLKKDGGGKTERKSVQQQTLDRSHKESPHWEAGTVKERDGQIQMNNYNRPKLESNKSKVNY